MSYRSRQTAPGWVRGIGTALVVAGLAAGVVVATVVARDAPAAAGATAVGVLIGISVGVLLVRASIVVEVDSAGVELAFPPLFRRTFSAAEITDVRDAQVSPASYGGTGLRVVPGRTGLFFHGGRGVEIAATDGRTYAVVVPDPDALRTAVEQVRARGAA